MRVFSFLLEAEGEGRSLAVRASSRSSQAWKVGAMHAERGWRRLCSGAFDFQGAHGESADVHV
jgi:hypothetical protein